MKKKFIIEPLCVHMHRLVHFLRISSFSVLFFLMSVSGLFAESLSQGAELLSDKEIKKENLLIGEITGTQQNNTVSGNVTDESGVPLPGVSIFLKGTTTGVTTDIDGNFTIEVSDEDQVLVFSFMGMKTLELAVKDQQLINVVLEDDVIGLEEVVAVGYGTQKKANLTGAVTQIDAEQLESRPVSSFSQSLQGTMPGLTLTRSSGRDNVSTSINIRGFTSINGGNPLVLIDGIEGDIDVINPRDVESVTVLKDAAASAIYGSRGAFGVILVTTKNAKEGTTRVNYDNNFSWSTPTTNTNFMTDPYETIMLVDESFRGRVGRTYTGYSEKDYEELKKRSEDPSLPDYVVENRKGQDQYIYYGNTDWYHTTFRTWRPSQNHNFSVIGGSEKVRGLLSGRVYDSKGILKIQDDEFKSHNIRGKIEIDVKDWLTLFGNLQYNNNSNLEHGGSHNGWAEPWGSYIWVHALPSYLPKNPDGTATYRTELNNYTIGDGLWSQLYYGKTFRETKFNQLVNTIGANVKPLKNFDIHFDYTAKLDFSNTYTRTVKSPWAIYPDEISYLGNDSYREVIDHDEFHAINLYGTYSLEKEKHSLKGMVGFNQEDKLYKTVDARKKNLISDDLNALTLGTSDPEAYGTLTDWAVRGFFYRLNYNFDRKYLLELNGRYDGTSRFPEDFRWGFFPSASVGWYASNENFFQGIKDYVNEFKLRASYGSLGNQEVGAYDYSPTMSQGTSGSYVIDGQKVNYITPPGLNPLDITWETVNTIDFGFDMAFWRNRFALNFDWFERQTTGMLTKGKTLPAVIGTGSPKENAADLSTKGFEITLSFHESFNLAGKPLRIDLTGVLSNSKSEITRFDNPNNYLGDYYVGQTIGEIWGYTIDGLFQSDEEAAAYDVDQTRVNSSIQASPGEFGKLLGGDMKYVDLDGDKEISNGEYTLENPGDMKIIGNSSIQFPYSFVFNADWNNINLSLTMQGVGKQDWYPSTDSRIFWGPYARPYVSFIRKDLGKEVWSEDNKDAYFPSVYRGYGALGSNRQMGAVNDRYLQDISYLRLKNLTVSYTIPSKLTQKVSIQKLKVYFSGENLLTFSKLTDYIDPEQASATSTAQTYPFSKVYSMGLSITL
ncbi:SusC/RagA family TonB-linked outer membrane protein [Maribellus comscasis]|uniref:SusC/RagA family TonB-linked outer membrane protein n=1 Tax=Maribellus comscasis TaxID=2681766 RepID=A0A6I6JJ88_9BACT|nr:TonB-dependent receptor [Maribellus comscasis]QGY42331.1 SusC/RagA family TonB-linked outer membrane protein [Maribellus comscasis]